MIYQNAPWQQIIHPHELAVLRWVGKHAEKPLIYDVGANEGQYARAVREVFGDRAGLVCFEPNPACMPELRKIDIDELHQEALSSAPGKRPMYMKIPEGPDIEASFHLRRDLHLLAPRGYARLHRTDTVPIVRLDDVAGNVSRIDLLKIDTEGHELEVLKGGRTTLERVQTVQFEFSFTNSFNPQLTLAQFRELLEPAGLRLLIPIGEQWLELPPEGIQGQGQTDLVATRWDGTP